MRSLEEITRDLFSNYSERKTGVKAPWHKLSSSRKADWMEDSYLIIEEILGELKKQLKQEQTNKNPNASYERGMLEGMRKERNRMEHAINNILISYNAQFLDFVKKDNL